MKKIILIVAVCAISVSTYAQSFKCPTISYRNNGNNSDCPGEVVTDNKGNTSIPEPVNSGLSSYSIPTTKKEGTLTMEFDQKYTDIPTLGSVKDANGNALSVQFGPPSNWTSKTNSDALNYCFYNEDLPAAGKLFVMVINKGATGTSYGTCTYDGQTLVSAPTITTQPTGKLDDCKGNNYTFSCSATANGNNTTLSYQWIKNGTAISGATSSSYSLSSVTNASNGDYMVVVKETYSNGNAVEQESNVAKYSVDAVKPVAVAKNVTLNLDATGSGSITAAQVNNGSSDACGIKSYSLNKSAFDCSNVGNNTVTLTVTDNNDNVSTVTATLTVVDNTKPTVVAKNVTVYLDAPGKASISTSDINNGSSDNCSFTLSLDKTDFVCTDKGTQTVTLTATDASGNTNTATATVTVVDNTKPTVVTQNATVYLDASGKASISTSDINSGSSDNCSFTLSLDKTDFVCTDKGAQTVTLTATDASGNTNTATATVTVVDNTKPTVVTKNYEIEINNGADVTVVASDVNDGSTDNCAITKYTLTGDKTKYGCSDRGKSFTVTLTAEDASGNSSFATAKVTVKGSLTQTPVISTDWKGLNNDGFYWFPYHSDKSKFSTTTKTGYTYSWSGNDISGSKTSSTVYVLPTKEGKIALTATATDADGCTATASTSLCVFNVAVPNSNNTKVYVCHNKGSNSVGATSFVTVEVSISGANSHLTQHSYDKIGDCTKTYDCGKITSRSNSNSDQNVGQLLEMGDHMSVLVYPNPSNDVFIIDVESEELTNVSKVIISDMMGRVVETATMNPNVAIEVGRELIPGMYNITVSNGGMVSSSRLIKR